MKLIVRADDYGLTDGVTWGILKGFREGIITCAGLMTNMEASKEAARQIRLHPEFSFGQDINLVAGKPVGDPASIPSLVDERGFFKKSGYFRQEVKAGREPLVYEEVLQEVRAQVEKFIELTGKKPDYLNGHSFRSPNFSRALKEVADEYRLINMDEIRVSLEECFSRKWYSYPATVENQLANNPEEYVLAHFDEILQCEIAFFNCHPGFLDGDLLQYSSLNAARIRDLEMVTSPKIKGQIQKYQIELISVKEFMETR